MDHYPLVHTGLVAMIECELCLKLAGQATDTDSAYAVFARLLPCVVLLDLRIPGGGLVDIVRIRALHAHAHFVVLTESEQEMTSTALFLRVLQVTW